MFGNHLLDVIFSPWAAYTLYCASRLGIFKHLSAKSLTVEDLAAKTATVPRLLEGLLDACAAMRLLHQNNRYYSNSYLANIYLVPGNPFYLGDIIEVMASESGKFEGLVDLVKGNNIEKKDIKREVSPHRFTMAMNNLAMLGEANALVNSVDLAHCRQMADVGCGSGLYSIVLCQRYPDLQAVLLDRKEVLETTEQMLEKNNLRHRIKTRAVDIARDSYGDRFDLVLLSDVLYQEETVCLAILDSAYKALARGGTLLVRGYYSNPGGTSPIFSTLFNLAQLLDDPGRKNLSVSLVSEWIKQTGFNSVRTFFLTEKSTCFTAQK